MSRPFTSISPELAGVRQFIIRSSVDLPAPELPMMPIIIGRSTEKLAA
jgi:hypothetical protein